LTLSLKSIDKNYPILEVLPVIYQYHLDNIMLTLLLHLKRELKWRLPVKTSK